MEELLILSQQRQKIGTGHSRLLRRKGEIPAVIYGFGQNYNILLQYKDFIKEYLKGNILSKLTTIQFGDQKLKTIPRAVQIDPVTDNPIHVDFQLIKDTVPIKVAVAVRIRNREKSPGLKRGGILNVVQKYIDLICIPKNIPTILQIDIAGFEIGRNVHISDIQLPEGVVPVTKDDLTVLTISGKVDEQEEEQVQETDNHEPKE